MTLATAPAPVGADRSGPTAIRLRALRKRFGDVLALDSLDLDVPAGSVFGLLGPNGAGKTTAIRILTALARPTSGSIDVLGVEPGVAVRAGRVGYLPQEPRFYGWMRGRELLELVARLHLPDDRSRRERVARALDAARLSGAADRRIGTYSGGMRQRLGIAQALLHNPDLLVLDEPVSSLDPEGRRDVLELIDTLRGRATVLLSTHVLSDVERVCDRVAILDRGRLVAEGELTSLLAGRGTIAFRIEPEPGQGAAVAALTRGLADAAWVRRVDAGSADAPIVVGVEADEDGQALLRLVLDSGVRLAAFARVRPTLEDVFLELVARPRPDELDGRGFVRPRDAR
jgi:ABC-2 type transport system ATP-binding protein